MIKKILIATVAAALLAPMAYAKQDVDKGVQVFVSVAQKTVEGLSDLSLADKRATVMEICEEISHKANYNTQMSETTSLEAPGGFHHETVMVFPYLDSNMDGVKDNASCNVELWHEDTDKLMRKTDSNQYMGALPWAVSVVTVGDEIKVNMRSPEASVRVFMHDEKKDTKKWERKAREIEKDFKTHLQLVLSEDEDFRFSGLDDMSGTALTTQRIEDLLDAADEKYMKEYGTPTISFDANGYTVEDIVEAIILGANACRTPDLNDDGTAGCQAEDLAMLPDLFNGYVQGDEQPLVDALGMAMPIWENGGTLQKWKSVKTYAPEGAKGNLHQISVCMPFYATTMLNITGAYHQTVMPCRVMVWKNDGEIFVSMSNPEMFLDAFFFDSALPENLKDLFPVFATLVYNEIAAMVNHTLDTELAISEQLELHDLGSLTGEED